MRFCGGSPTFINLCNLHLEAIGKFIKAGFDHIGLVQIGPNQDYFLELFEKELAPALRKGKAAK